MWVGEWVCVGAVGDTCRHERARGCHHAVCPWERLPCGAGMSPCTASAERQELAFEKREAHRKTADAEASGEKPFVSTDIL